LQQTPLAPEFRPMTTDEKADVCIVGGGIGGLTTAYLLLREGKSVVLLEDGQIASGESGRTTAHLMSAVDDRYCIIEKHLGKEIASIVAESHSKAIDMIEEIVRTEKIECDFARLDGYLFGVHSGRPSSFVHPPPVSSSDRKLLEQECDAALRSGLRGVQLVDKTPLPSFNTGLAVKFPGQGQIHPTKYLYQLAQAVSQKGGRIYTDTHASSFEKTNVTTQNGCTVTCQNLVVATNLPVNDRVTMYTKVEPWRSYVIAGRIKKGAIPLALYWDTADPYHYIRLAKGYDPDHDLLIVGGEDHKSGQASDYEERYQRLENWTRERIPEMKDVVDRWSGHIIETMDDLAYLGRNPGDENVYIITGDSGNGMTHGTIGGMLIKDLILGRPNRWEKAYNPSRKPIHLSEMAEWVKHNVDVGIQYLHLVQGSELSDLEDLPRGEGCVMRQLTDPNNSIQNACYKDNNGKLHIMSAICPHLGCVVKWNTSEKSWDCPCHGSRFDSYGTVVNGPSNKNLEPIKVPEPTGQSSL